MFARLDRTPGRLSPASPNSFDPEHFSRWSAAITLDQITDVHRYVDHGHKIGTVVITMWQP